MLRLLRTKQNLFRPGARRLPPNVRPGPDSIQLQRVKIRRKWFRPWIFLGSAAIYYACYQIYTTSVFSILGKWLDEQYANMSAKERKLLEKEIEETDASFFIPLPGTTHMIEPRPYRGSDPEWKQFAQLSRDPKQITDVKYTLAQYVRKAIEGHPIISRDFGKDWKLTRTWFDVNYPQRPPPTFERQGICWDDDGISIATQPVDSATVFKLQRTLMPTAATLSLWSFSTTLAKHNFWTMAKYLGYDAKPDPSSQLEQTLDRLRQHIGKTQSRPPPPVPDTNSLESKSAETKDLAPTTKRQTADGAAAGSTPSAPPPEGTAQEASGKGFPQAIRPFSRPAPEGSEQKIPSAKDIYGVKEVSATTTGAWQAMRQKFRRVWRPVRPFPPRGSVEFRGLVEVASSKASIVVDVQAFYDPKSQTIDTKTMVLGLRTLKPRQMAPAR
ncbi:hypothetical protein JX265_007297 [Neoarthrinium moseri]|uniref:Uncharacterized protein n=1 Tax=Neoarthrinium moseri TaxID=1658444 RepID=A0A9P9WK10_9PEZI|nr:uncharacterized protein JN550_012071 [Neoarthrinium moseri]KAI1850972.1 hypothetical protein JX266_003637 [Neoarthrinium moseri]KAI1859262.1 hypothetical protein JN550_012071 [Neoarthrinium moseri]KAI1867495.1 hypothetical protein JX265_007297 [Neoarthrinium moseri]